MNLNELYHPLWTQPGKGSRLSKFNRKELPGTYDFWHTWHAWVVPRVDRSIVFERENLLRGDRHKYRCS